MFELLDSFRDHRGRPPAITANCVTANPDFAAIREQSFGEYRYEPITETFKRYPNHAGVFQLWKEGMDRDLFFPQFHGREHLNAEYWMKELRRGNPALRAAFDRECWIYDEKMNGRINLQASLDTEHIGSLVHHREILSEGLELFETLFGFRSRSYIANNFICHTDLYETLKEDGVEYIQGMKYQLHPILSGKRREMIRRYMGEKNRFGQIHLVRNCVFEPSQKPVNFDNIGECLKDISNAFFWKKPAIITAHRLNFVGFLRPENREKNLGLFKELLTSVLRRWPNVEFMSSPELGDLITGRGNAEGRGR